MQSRQALQKALPAAATAADRCCSGSSCMSLQTTKNDATHEIVPMALTGRIVTAARHVLSLLHAL
jgi:hypothetical protein